MAATKEKRRNMIWNTSTLNWEEITDNNYAWYPGKPEPLTANDFEVWSESRRKKEERVDMINHPPHYAAGRKYEPIDVIEDWKLDYHLATALKYISRAGRKGAEAEDIQKAIWFLQRKLNNLNKEEAQ